MDASEDRAIWTIGHSTRSIEDFLRILKVYNIELLADVRSYPGSRRFPHFNKNMLDIRLARDYIEYLHIPELGGKQNPNSGSQISLRKNSSFRSYAIYMETDPFSRGINLLSNISNVKRTAIMCAEAMWRKCHRSMISDYLKSKNIKVIHIIDESRTEVHTYTQSALLIQGKLEYQHLSP
jgi:uncharacterized protein (DUF488 family)